LPLAAIGGGAVLAASQFESSFAGVRKTVKATDAEFAVMAQQFRDLALEIPVNVNELNRLGEAAGALGIPKAEIVDFARVMALLGVTTNLTSDQAAEGIAKIQNIFGTAGVATENFASTLVALGNDGASTETQILEMANRIAGAGNVIGLTQGEVLAFASALASVGLEAEAGGTAISRVFIDIAAAVSEGGDAVAGFAEVVGVPIQEFQRLFKEDAATAVSEFIGGLTRIKESGGDLLGTLEQLGFKEIRVRDTLLRAAGAGDLLTRALDLQKTAWEENNALTNEATERFKTFESQAKLLYNKLYDLGIELGNQLLPYLLKIVDAAKPVLEQLVLMVKAFADLPQPVQTAALGFLAFAAVLGPIVGVVGRLYQAGSSLLGIMKLLGKTEAFKFLAGGGGAAGVGTALAVGGGLAIGNSAMTRDDADVNAAYMELANLPSIKGPAKDIELLSESLNVLAVGPGAPGFVAGGVVKLGEAFTGLTPSTSAASKELERAAEKQKHLREEILQTAIEAENQVTSFEFFQKRAAQPLQVALAGLGAGWNDLTEAIIPTRTGMDGLEPILAHLGNTTVPTLDEEMERLGYTLGDYGPTLEQAQKEFKTFGDFLKNDLGKVILSAFQGGGNVGQSIGSAIGGFLTGPSGVIGQAVSRIGGTLGSVLGSVVPGLGSLLGGLAGNLFGRLFSDPERQINPIRQAFVNAAGGLDILNQRAAAAGVTLTALLDARNPEQYRIAIEALQAAFAFQDQAMQTLDETTRRYGFTLEELGPALQRQELGKQAEQLYQDFTILTTAGIDTTAVLTRMGESVNAFVQGALRTGTEVPAAMQPMLQQFVAAGLLFDQNGEAITDLGASGLTFAESMSQGFTRVVESVNRLADAIARGLGLSLDSITTKANAAADAMAGLQAGDVSGGLTYWDTSGGPLVIEARRGGLVTSHGIQHFAAGGFAQGRDTVPAMLSPGELVLNKAQQASLADSMPSAVNVTVNAQGAYFDAVTTERLARRIAEPLAKIIAGNKGGAHTQYRAALNLTV
jgi:TP901 family phage tail tape measure protein